ncbi:hypothetical protein J6590_065223 [Homalodisca vitripennis]|nr:hypothetical protein J6590_065223 [Homalodisca vitripennis]
MLNLSRASQDNLFTATHDHEERDKRGTTRHFSVLKLISLHQKGNVVRVCFSCKFGDTPRKVRDLGSTRFPRAKTERLRPELLNSYYAIGQPERCGIAR